MSESSQQSEQVANRKEPALEHKAPRDSGWTIKDYVTLTLSILAFVVSGGSAYFNILRVEENVSVAVDFRVFAVRDQENLSVSSTQETPIVFVNSGNKPVAVMSASFVYFQTKGGGSTECSWEDGTRLKTDLD